MWTTEGIEFEPTKGDENNVKHDNRVNTVCQIYDRMYIFKPS